MSNSRYVFFILFILLLPAKGFASVVGEVNKANDLYKQGKFDDSLDLYQQALAQDNKSSVLKYDLGTAFYKKGDYAKALEYLRQAAEDKNIKIKPRAEYNLGNTLFKSGVQKEKSNVDEAIKTLQDSLGQYGLSLKDNPQDADASYNEGIVKKEIEHLKQQKQQQKQAQQNQQNQQNQQKQNQQKQNQQQNQQQSQQNQQTKQQGQENQKPSHAEDSYKSQSQQQGQAQENQQLDRKAAQDLLEEYQENEEPQKLLSYMPKKIDNRPVLKDW